MSTENDKKDDAAPKVVVNSAVAACTHEGCDEAAAPTVVHAVHVDEVRTETGPERTGACVEHGGKEATELAEQAEFDRAYRLAKVPGVIVKTAEAWAHELGHLPEYKSDPPPKEKPKKAMPRVYNPKAQLFLAAKHHHTWAAGKELTKSQYLAGVEAATTHVFR